VNGSMMLNREGGPIQVPLPADISWRHHSELYLRTTILISSMMRCSDFEQIEHSYSTRFPITF